MNTWPDGVGRILAGEVDSTNLEARRIAHDLDDPTWILARSQTRGRGRQGRKWDSPEGNFYATLVMQLAGPLQSGALRSMVAALALRDSLESVSGGKGVLLTKWPNDILLNGGKVAGILLETVQCKDCAKLLIGIGVNLDSAPSLSDPGNADLTPVSVREATGISVSPEEFLGLLATSYERRESQFLAWGFEPIRCEWLRHAWRLGEEASFRMERDEVRGVFESVDADGCAVVRASGARHRVSAADMLTG